MTDKAIICTGTGVDVFRLLSLKGMVKMESKGMKGRINATAHARKEFGLKARAPHAEVIAAIQAAIDATAAKLKPGEIATG